MLSRIDVASGGDLDPRLEFPTTGNVVADLDYAVFLAFVNPSGIVDERRGAASQLHMQFHSLLKIWKRTWPVLEVLGTLSRLSIDSIKISSRKKGLIWDSMYMRA